MTIELERLLSPEAYARLQAEAERQNTAVAEVVRDALEQYLDDTEGDEIEDTPREKVLADLREAVEDVNAGRTRSADEALADIRSRLANG